MRQIYTSSLIIASVGLLCGNFCVAQNQMTKHPLTRTSEKIVKYNIDSATKHQLGLPAPTYSSETLVLYESHSTSGLVDLFKLDDQNNSMRLYFKTELSARIFDFFAVHDSIIFCSERVSSSMEDYGYSKLQILIPGHKIYLDSIFNKDKKIYSQFSRDGGLLVVSTLNTLSDYYNLGQDDQFVFYRLDSIKLGKIKRFIVPCRFCGKPRFAGEKIFFTKANQRDDFSGGFLYTDLYMAPANSIKDSIKVASFSDIVAVSSDGRFVLARRIFDLSNSPCAVIDVASRKYQLLLGRDYSKAFAFYSVTKEKFAFHFGDRLVYVDMPKEFPFDALQKSNSQIPNWTNKIFYSQFLHKPFDD